MSEFKKWLIDRFIIERKKFDRSGVYAYTQRVMAYNSNKIEGSTLTPEQTASLFDNGTLPRSDDYYRAKDVEEMNGHFLMFNYMLDFAGQNEFVENLQIELFLKQFCALFTSYCLIYGIDADSLECDSTLMILFDMINAKLPDDVKGDYDTFYQYMVKYIV